MSSAWLTSAPPVLDWSPQTLVLEADLERALQGSLDDMVALAQRIEGNRDLGASLRIAQAALEKMETAGVPWHHALDMLLAPRGVIEPEESDGPLWRSVELARARFSRYLETASEDPLELFRAFSSNVAREALVGSSPKWSVESMRELHDARWANYFLGNPAIMDAHLSAIADACLEDLARDLVLVKPGTLTSLCTLLPHGWRPTKEQREAVWHLTDTLERENSSRHGRILTLLPVLCHRDYPLSSERMRDISIHEGRPRLAFLRYMEMILAQPGRTDDDASYLAETLGKLPLETLGDGDDIVVYSGLSCLLESPWGARLWSDAWKILQRRLEVGGPTTAMAGRLEARAWQAMARVSTPGQYAQVWKVAREKSSAAEVLANGTPEQWAALGLAEIEDLANSSDGALRKAVILASGYTRGDSGASRPVLQETLWASEISGTLCKTF